MRFVTLDYITTNNIRMLNKLFDEISKRNVVSWNAMSSYEIQSTPIPYKEKLKLTQKTPTLHTEKLDSEVSARRERIIVSLQSCI